MAAIEEHIVFHDLILVPTDFSEVCNHAVDYAAQMAKSLNFKLEILHIIDADTKEYLKENQLQESAIFDKLKDLVTEIGEKHDIEANFIVRSGGVYRQVGEIAAEIGASLVVLGTHGKVGFQKITGSHAMKVVEYSPVPVIVVQNSTFTLEGINNILVPISIYAEVRQKASWAIHMARTFNAKVHLFQFFEKDRENDYNQEVITKHITDYFKKYKVDYDIKVAQGGINYGDQVLRYGDHINADLIMVMTTQGKFFNFEFGDYDEKIMFNRYKIPTMFINPKFYSRVKLFAAWNDR